MWSRTVPCSAYDRVFEKGMKPEDLKNVDLTRLPTGQRDLVYDQEG